MSTLTTGLAQRVLDAYDGEARWRAAKATQINLDAGGLIFSWKRHGAVHGYNFKLTVAEPRVRIWPVDAQGTVGILEGHDVRLESPDGRVLASRPNARQYFPYGRRLFRWDLIDMVYFVGYSNWNYVNLPALLLRDDIEWRQTAEDILEAKFPPYLPTHSERQRFYFDPNTHLLKRHDFVAQIVSPLATAAHVIEAYGNWNGIPYATRRRFRSRAGNQPHSRIYGPFMVWVDIHSFEMT